jgi:hypothetical protein
MRRIRLAARFRFVVRLARVNTFHVVMPMVKSKSASRLQAPSLSGVRKGYGGGGGNTAVRSLAQLFHGVRAGSCPHK